MNEILNKLFVGVEVDSIIRIFHEPTTAWWSGKVVEIDEEVIVLKAINPIENEWSLEPYNEECISRFQINDISVVQKREKIVDA